ncbi:MAG: FAD-dependent oxidoreductase [Nitrospira sp.]|nr:FAD-dependent oxidoreductase [Nitrospira sp.]
MKQQIRRGTKVIVVGAGLAGLTAAVKLKEMGAKVSLIEARDRVGGRVFTIRGAFAQGQHAEAGGDFIDEGQHEIKRLVKEQGLTLRPILRKGFAFVRYPGPSRRRRRILSGEEAWNTLSHALYPLVAAYRTADKRWDSPIAKQLARQSVAQWLEEGKADSNMRAVVRSLRGFFLADPEDLSLLALVDQLAGDVPGPAAMSRIEGGNDRLPLTLAEHLREDLRLNSVVQAICQDRNSVRVRVETSNGQETFIQGKYVVLAVPTTTLRSIHMGPPLPAMQSRAIDSLKYGRTTKTLLQFDRSFWRKKAKPQACGTDAPTGAFWDANEEQAGEVGILTLMAGGQASEDTQKIVAQRGVEGLVKELDWMGSRSATLLHSRIVTWEDDPWAQGGYAYFDPGFDPHLRSWLGRRHGRIIFAGEHTSLNWQGYMNGAVESGLRAVEEICAMTLRNEGHPV